MAAPASSRMFGELTFQEAGLLLGANSLLCLPMGSLEQHGPHLPLNTDTVIAEAFTRRIVERWSGTYDLWQLPSVTIGLSREHSWAAGTLSVSVSAITDWLRELAREIVRALPVRRLLIVNGHGGNRGLLEALVRELSDDFGLRVCALHLGAMMSPVPDTGLPEIHAGRDETSVMLALAPELVRRERLTGLKAMPDGEAVRRLVLDPAVSHPWSSGDGRIADCGVMGDAASASAELGAAIVASTIQRAGAVIDELCRD
jgi:creatinine amidohydrolase/Fe(II)-dependent formamide hydrolase-like protein